MVKKTSVVKVFSSFVAAAPATDGNDVSYMSLPVLAS